MVTTTSQRPALNSLSTSCRAGAHGEAVSFVTAQAQAHWALIRKREQLDLPLEVLPGFEPQDAPPAPAPGNGGIKGNRPSKKDKLRAAQAIAVATDKKPA